MWWRFQGNTYLQELTLLRRQSAEIILDTTDGHAGPPGGAACGRPDGDGEGPGNRGGRPAKEVSVTGVYCVSGAKARFKPVEVLLHR